MKLSDLLNRIEKMQPQRKSNDSTDERFWKPTKDKTDNAYAVVRFLPSANEDDLPFVRLYQHGFQTKSGKWFVEECPTTVERECPVCDANRVLWDEGSKENKELASERKRKLSFISNILVIQDKENPENEGKVMLWRYGQKVFDKLMEAMKPTFVDEDVVPFNPFDPEEGHNFKVKVSGSGRDTSYDASSFAMKSNVIDMKEVTLVDLSEFKADARFKSYEDIQKKFDSAVNGKSASKSSATEGIDVSDDDTDDDEFIRQQMAKAKAAKAQKVDDDDQTSSKKEKEPEPEPEKEEKKAEVKEKKVEEKSSKKEEVKTDDDDDDDYFKKLAAKLEG